MWSPICLWIFCVQLCFIGTLGSGQDVSKCKSGANGPDCSKEDSPCSKQGASPESRKRKGSCSSDDKRPFGLLSPGCVAHYSRLYVTRRVPPRNYRYFHEILQGEQDSPHDVVPVTPLSWRIVGGDAIDITEAPFMVLYGEYCGGTLIAPEWVLTAAHCTTREKFILAGSTLKSQAKRYDICAHFVHPLWTASQKQHPHDWDYQLVLLDQPVPVTPMSRPIAIGSPSDIQIGFLVGVSGWGHLKYQKSSMQDQLRRVYVPIMSNEDCSHVSNPSYWNITERMFCAGLPAGNKDSCQGDSGGPAVYNGKLVGLVSFGVGCAKANQPGVYARIPYARDWIRSITGLPL